MVPINHDGVAIEGGGCALAEAHFGPHLAEVLRPFQISIEVIAVKTARAKEGEQKLAVGDRGGGGEGVILLMAFMRDRLASDFLPQGLAGLAVQAENRKLVK